MNQDGVRQGYDVKQLSLVRDACSVPLIASGGAGTMEHFYDAVEAGATILLAASVFHFHDIDIGELKKYLQDKGVPLL